MQKLDSMEGLNGDFAHLTDLEALVAVILNEVIKTLAKRFKH